MMLVQSLLSRCARALGGSATLWASNARLPFISGHFQRVPNREYTDNNKVLPSCRVRGLNHVAIAVPDIEKATSLYRDVFGAQVSDVVALPEHGVYTVFVQLNNTKIELLHPYGENSPIQSYLNKNKSGGLHHICYEVEDIEAAIIDVRAKGIRTLTETSKIGAHGLPVIFLHPKDCNGVLIELEQV